MIKWLNLLLIVLLAAPSPVLAQRQVNDATLHYTIEVQSSGSSKLTAMNGATMKVFIKATQSKSVMESSLGSETNVYDAKAGKGFILKSYSGQQLMITMTKANWQQKNKTHASLKFTTEDTDEKFGNYKLKKATSVLPGGRTYTVYYTPDLILNNKEYNNAFPQLPGVPVRYSVVSGDIVFTYTLGKIETDPVPSAAFIAPTSGYRTMTYEENMQLRKDGIR
ncbi:MAG TPA: hypothetical protein PKY29_09690 [Ferruginibacter sp.]|nr:hypothetical protein [Ferruginibacter sp.]HRO18285.1 hypothetical protein [Ferruginibacter sp.]HRQ21576.1 hypothetical protein [Ferruginibacter sp.]